MSFIDQPWEDFIAKRVEEGRLHALGGDHYYSRAYGSPDYWEDHGWPRITSEDSGEELVLVGITEWHKNKEGYPCGGHVRFARALNPTNAAEVNRPVWKVNSLVPLDIEPSVACTTCPAHGFIRQGMWVDA